MNNSYYKTLEKMRAAAINSKYPFPVCENIINAIMGYYMTEKSFQLSDCIASFDRFLTSGVLSMGG